MSKFRTHLTKIFVWEHWPTFMFYTPLVPYYMYQAIKSRHLIFYLVANPGIKFSGNGTESKFETLKLIPKEYKPTSVLVVVGTTFSTIIRDLKQAKITFPLIAKPDVGFRGFLVKKIKNLSELELYFTKVDVPVILQEFIDSPNECGIFYHRMPGERKGKITSITLKQFLTVTGDGKLTLRQLIEENKRAVLYISLFESLHKAKMDTVPQTGEIITLSQIGNHSKGTAFLNGNHLIDSELEQVFDRFADQIKEWNYGRIDLKYHSMEEIKEGKPFTVLEINGILSEPTHIYDASKSTYFSALGALQKHWGILSDLARKNHRINGIPYPRFYPYLKNMIWLRRYSRKLKRLNKTL